MPDNDLDAPIALFCSRETSAAEEGVLRREKEEHEKGNRSGNRWDGHRLARYSCETEGSFLRRDPRTFLGYLRACSQL